MTMKTWKEEFYPTRAMESEPGWPAVSHSIVKWHGLREENVKKHDLVFSGGNIVELAGDREVAAVYVDTSTCALCQTATVGCSDCPLYISRGHFQCDEVVPGESTSPWHRWVKHHNPEPMIKVLEAITEEHVQVADERRSDLGMQHLDLDQGSTA